MSTQVTVTSGSVGGSIAATGQGATATGGGKYRVRIYGTFAGTWVIQSKDPDATFRDDPETDATGTAAALRIYDGAGNDIRIDFTRTSGTLDYFITSFVSNK